MDKYEGMTVADKAYFKAQDEGKDVWECVSAATEAALRTMDEEGNSLYTADELKGANE